MSISSIIIAVLCLIGACALIATRFKVKLPKHDKGEKDDKTHTAAHEPETKGKPASTDHGQGAHGHDHHKKSGPISFAVSVLLILVGLVAAYGAFIWLNQVNRSSLNQMVRQTSASASAWVPPPPAPPESIDCKGLTTLAVMLAPSQTVVVRVPLNAIFSYLPEVADGTIEVCDYHTPGDKSRCSSSEERRNIATNAFTVRNKTERSEPFFCSITPKP